MPTKTANTVIAALFLAGCAATTPPPRFSAVSPADPDGPEAGTPPPAPALAGEPEAHPPSPSGDTPPAVGCEGHSTPAGTPAPRGHEGHSSAAPEATRPADQPYSCPIHPEATQASPGSCPKCGMQFSRSKDARQQP
jgi:predicted RNA-binding Zn-ribbon protein involved in translation (DUF1610 family)